MRRGPYPWRAKAGIAVVLLMAALALGSLAGYWSVLPDAGSPDIITLDERRFTGLRAVLPRRGVIGFLSDIEGQRENRRAYYLTQYFLAPLVVAPDAKHELVVANFASRSAVAGIAAANGLTVVQDFENGVALLRRTGR
jgi:hypothetical protein